MTPPTQRREFLDGRRHGQCARLRDRSARADGTGTRTNITRRIDRDLAVSTGRPHGPWDGNVIRCVSSG